MKKPPPPQKRNAFDKKVTIFSHDYLKCCLYITAMDDPGNDFTKKLYSKLISSSMLLEDFLDFHGAKNNKNWYYYRELSAAVRHLSLGANFQKHLSNRLLFYDLSDYSDFQKDGEVTLEFLTRTLLKMAPVILEEARRHDIPLPEDQFHKDDWTGAFESWPPGSINFIRMISRASRPVICFHMILMIRTRIYRKRTS